MEGDIYSWCLLGFIFGEQIFLLGEGLIYGEVFTRFYGIRIKG